MLDGERFDFPLGLTMQEFFSSITSILFLKEELVTLAIEMIIVRELHFGMKDNLIGRK